MGNNRINLSICVWDFEGITPESVTELLGLVPDRVYRKGEPRQSTTSIVWRMNGWCRKSGVSEQGTFEEHLDALCTIIRPRVREFSSLAEKYCVEIGCEVVIDTAEDSRTPWLHLTKEHTKLLGEVGISLDFDLYKT